MNSFEMNFDAIVGSTHNYGGLSFGNVASMESEHRLSNPKKAALQGLEKMHTLMSYGIKQGVLPPHERPFIAILHALGFYGSPAQILEKAALQAPELVEATSSAAAMWAANAVTVSPSADTQDGKVHFSVANLHSKFHRSFEAPITAQVFKKIFYNTAYFAHHPPLPYHDIFSDEGAANHCRFCKNFDEGGIELFVYGNSPLDGSAPRPKIFPARHSLEASKAIVRRHRLHPERVIFAQQHPEAIDAGVFHNDVIATSHQNLFFFHEKAFLKTEELLAELHGKMEKECGSPLIVVKVSDEEIPLAEAIKTYLFNSQIITLSDGSMLLLAPKECHASPIVSSYLESLVKNHEQPVRKVVYQDIRESMQNGGGPACLRQRVILTLPEYQSIHKGVELTEVLYQKLVSWVNKHYRDRLLRSDLSDPSLIIEGQNALDELSSLLGLGAIYPFQMGRMSLSGTSI